MSIINNSISQQNLVCKYCGSVNFETRPHEMHGFGAWCKDCGKFIKWLGKTRTAEETGARAENKKLYIKEYLACQDPTKPQMEYLDKLKYHGYVGSRLHAYNLIEGMVGGGTT